jgi:hypothetical protein
MSARDRYFAALCTVPPPGKRSKPRNLEGPVQQAVIAKIKSVAPWCYVAHVPNGGKRSIAQQRRVKQDGIKAGVPDLYLLLSTGVTAWIEVKAPGKKLQPAQVAFRDMCLQRQVPWALVDDADDIPDLLISWGEDVRGEG